MNLRLSALLCGLLSGLVLAKPLTVCTDASPEGFDAARHTSAATQDAATEALYNRLVEFDRNTAGLQPGLAEKWVVGKLGLEYTFHLRRNVKFHTTETFRPTRDFNADDVIWTFSRLLDSKHPGAASSPAVWPYAHATDFAALVKRIDRLDDKSVRFTLNRPDAAFLANLATGMGNILSAEYAAQLLKAGKLDQLGVLPVGTGPFLLKKYEQGRRIEYAMHTPYWRQRTTKEAPIFLITEEAPKRLERLKKNECQFALALDAGEMAALKTDKKFQVAQNRSLSLAFLAFNTEKKTLTDKRVREALGLAIDRAAIVQKVYGGAATAAHLPLPSALWGYDKFIKPEGPDPERAKRQLKEAGFEKGLEIELLVRHVGGANNPNPAAMAELIAADWKKIGVNARITRLDGADLQKRTRAGEHDAVLGNWTSDNADPDNFLAMNLSCAARDTGTNLARWCHKGFDALLDTARRMEARNERSKVYSKIQNLFVVEVPWVVLAEPWVNLGASSGVSGFKPSVLGSHNFENVVLR